MKRIFCLLLSIAMLFHAVPAYAGPAVEAKYGEYIDFKKLKTSFSAKEWVKLNIGGLPLWGRIQREAYLNDQEIETALKDAMDNRKINLTDLAAFEAAGELADKYAKGWTVKKVMDSVFEIFGADIVTDVVDLMMGTSEKTSVDYAEARVADHIKDKVIEEALTKKAPLLVGKIGLKTAAYSVSVLVNAGIVSIRELGRLLSAGKVESEGRKARKELEGFYRVANKKLAWKMEDAAGEWKIVFQNAAATRPNRELFGIDGISQTYTVNAELTRVEGTNSLPPGESGLMDISGAYNGYLDITITHNLYNFDQELIMLYIQLPFYEEMAGIGMQFMSMNMLPSTLKKNVYHNDFFITLFAPDSGKNVSRIPVDFDGFEETMDFYVGQDICYAHTEASVDPSATADGKGYIYGAGGGAYMKTNDYMYHSVFGAEPIGQTGVRLRLIGQIESGFAEGYVPGAGHFAEDVYAYDDLTDSNLILGEDNQIFSDLFGNCRLEVRWPLWYKDVTYR